MPGTGEDALSEAFVPSVAPEAQARHLSLRAPGAACCCLLERATPACSRLTPQRRHPPLHRWLYFGPLRAKLHKYKLNPVYPSFAQIRHDALFSTLASVCGAGVEIALCHLWATGRLRMDRSVWDRPVVNVLLAITITHWRVPHFWLIHRTMHPWRLRWLPDVGKLLYRHVHALHHKSYNPTAFSGTNMHPVEATLYYSAALVCLPLGPHPCVALGCIIDCGTARRGAARRASNPLRVHSCGRLAGARWFPVARVGRLLPSGENGQGGRAGGQAREPPWARVLRSCTTPTLTATMAPCM